MTLRRDRLWDPHHRVLERPLLVLLGCHFERCCGSLVLPSLQGAQPHLIMILLGANLTLWSLWFCFSSQITLHLPHFHSQVSVPISPSPLFFLLRQAFYYPRKTRGLPWVFTVSTYPLSLLVHISRGKVLWSKWWGLHLCVGPVRHRFQKPVTLWDCLKAMETRHKDRPKHLPFRIFPSLLIPFLFRETIGQRWFHTGKSPIVHFLVCPEIPALCLRSWQYSIVVLLLWSEK